MRRLPQLTKKRVISALFIIIVSIISQFIVPTNKNQNLQPVQTSTSASNMTVKVTRVIDGDTVEIDTGQKVRYIGIDTPELHDPKKPVQCFAQAAMEKNKELVEGKMVRLEKDVSETDKFGRLLRYVYVATEASPSGLFVNEYLVKEGYAHAATFPPDVKYTVLFTNSQQEARNNNKGLWQQCR